MTEVFPEDSMTTTFAPLPEPAVQVDPKPRLWTAKEYHRMHELGFFLDQRWELIGGEILGFDSKRPRRWTADEMYRLLDLGFFQDQRVELIGGEILQMAAQKNFHAAAITLTEHALGAAFGAGYWIRVQFSLDLSPFSVPDPDVAVVVGSPRTPAAQNPTSALLIVEASDTTLSHDRGSKASLYAAAGIQDYWIINLVNRQIEVHRNPVPDAREPYGWRYDYVQFFGPGDFIVPLAASQSRVAVDDLLP
jgi:Uma2 family endonuclease